ANVSFLYRPDIDKSEASGLISDFNGLIIRSKFQVDASFIDQAPNLQLIARAGAGTDNIDDHYAKEKNIRLFAANQGNCDAVGERMSGMLLGVMNILIRSGREVRAGSWLREENRGRVLYGKPVGLIGYGHIGRPMAKKLYGLDVRVIANDK